MDEEVFDVDDDTDYVQENDKKTKLEERNISLFKILVMVLLSNTYQKSRDIFEQVYRVFALNIVCSLKRYCLFIVV